MGSCGESVWSCGTCTYPWLGGDGNPGLPSLPLLFVVPKVSLGLSSGQKPVLSQLLETGKRSSEASECTFLLQVDPMSDLVTPGAWVLNTSAACVRLHVVGQVYRPQLLKKELMHRKYLMTRQLTARVLPVVCCSLYCIMLVRNIYRFCFNIL